MVLHVLRAIFILLMGGVGWFFVKSSGRPFGDSTWIAMSLTLTIGVFFLCVDILSPRKKLAIFSGTFLGLIVGLITAYGLSFVVAMVADQYMDKPRDPGPAVSWVQRLDYESQRNRREAILTFANVCVGVVCCYLAISFILQTKDDFRFIVPYVEFSKQIRGARPILVDTSIIIDGRILDIAETGIIESRLIVPRFVVQELQTLADQPDKLKRNRGKRGLDVLARLQQNKKIDVVIYDWTGHSSPEAEGADQKLLVLAKEINARIFTNDANLGKVAAVRGVPVVNVNEMATALRPVVLPGERMSVRVSKPGEEAAQGIGFLDDGTMVVVKDGRKHIDQDVEFIVTNVLQTATGRMIFGQIGEGGIAPRRMARPRETSA